MKTLWLILLLFPLVATNPVAAQKKNSKAEKAAQVEQEFHAIKMLMESNRFQVEIDRVYPQSGFDMSRFNPRGHISITDSTAKGNLPFFGRAYTLPYGEGGGIEFDAVMKNQTLKVNEKKKKKSILYNFSVPGNNDNYTITIEAAPGGGCSISLSSNNRTQISYSGRITPLPENKAEK